MAYKDEEKRRAYHRKRYHETKKLQNVTLSRDSKGRFVNNNSIDLPINELIESYNSGCSTYDLSEKYQVDKTIIGRLLKKNGITLRNSAELLSNKIGENNSRYNGELGITGSKWNVIVRCGQKRNLEFTITKEYVWNLFVEQNGLCKLSGVPITLPKTTKDKKTTASLDRIDSSKGYIEGNVQWVHKDVNIMKQDMTDLDFIKWCKTIGDYNS